MPAQASSVTRSVWWVPFLSFLLGCLGIYLNLRLFLFSWSKLNELVSGKFLLFYCCKQYLHKNGRNPDIRTVATLHCCGQLNRELAGFHKFNCDRWEEEQERLWCLSGVG